LRIDQAVLAMAGVGIERDIGDHAEFRETPLQRLHDARHQAIRVKASSAPGDFNEHRSPETAPAPERPVDGTLRGLQQAIQALRSTPRHRAHRLDPPDPSRTNTG
jgi:hypothetical protein